jgi:hypothetical protein
VLVDLSQHEESADTLFTYMIDIHHPISRLA